MTNPHIPIKSQITDNEQGDLISTCLNCGEQIVRNYYPEEPGERLARYSKTWNIINWVAGSTEDVLVARFVPVCDG